MSLSMAVFRWFVERLRDVFMWPLNLVRDFPVRLRRLLLTGWYLIQSAARAASRIGQATGGRAEVPAVRRQPIGPIAWLYRFITQIFDLLGGPEVAQFIAHLVTNTTPLNEQEMAAISLVLGSEAMRYQDVRVAEGGLLDLIFKYNGNLAYTTWRTIHFPRNGGGHETSHTRANLSVVVHELIHAYQYEQVGTRYLGEAIYMLLKTKRNCYDYGRAQGLRDAAAAAKRYCDFNREQQAQIVQDYYRLLLMNADLSAYEPFIAQLRSGEL